MQLLQRWVIGKLIRGSAQHQSTTTTKARKIENWKIVWMARLKFSLHCRNAIHRNESPTMKFHFLTVEIACLKFRKAPGKKNQETSSSNSNSPVAHSEKSHEEEISRRKFRWTANAMCATSTLENVKIMFVAFHHSQAFVCAYPFISEPPLQLKHGTLNNNMSLHANDTQQYTYERHVSNSTDMIF